MVGGAVLVRWAVRGGGDVEPECDESISQPMARLILLRTGPPEHGLKDVEGTAGERRGGAEGSPGAGQGQFSCSARPVLRGGRE